MTIQEADNEVRLSAEEETACYLPSLEEDMLSLEKEEEPAPHELTFPLGTLLHRVPCPLFDKNVDPRLFIKLRLIGKEKCTGYGTLPTPGCLTTVTIV